MTTFKKALIGIWLLALLAGCNLSPAALLGPTPTPSLTPTITLTPSPTPTITPSPMPTMIPLARVQIGEEALSIGDYETARAEFQTVSKTSNDDELRAAALWGLVRVNYEEEHYYEAIAFAQQLENEYPDSPFLAYAHFLAGAANTGINRHQAATESYAAYLELRPDLLANYVEELRGDAFVEMGDYGSALGAYQAALQAPSLNDGINLRVKVGTSKAAIGDYAGAIADYASIFETTNNEFIKARMDYLTGYAYIMLNEEEKAYEYYLHAVENYPLAYYAYLSLVALIESGVPVDDFNRGLIDYAAEQYDVALVAFDRFIAANPEHDGTATYYRAKTLYALGRYDEEVAAWNDFIENYPEHRYWSDAWEEKSYTQWADLNQLEAGKQTLLDFVANNPNHPESPRLLMNAARLMERKDGEAEAVELWVSLAETYPGSNYAADALFLAGIITYRQENYEEALTHFQRLLILISDKPEDKARAHFWIGKTQAQLGNAADAQNSWQQAQAANPSGYYSERAQDLLMGSAEPFALPDIYHPEVDTATELAEAASWIRVTFDLPAETNLNDLGSLASDLRLQRGREFWELGPYSEARYEFENLRDAVSNDPADSFRLANYMRELGLYRPAIFAAREVLTLAGMESHAESLRAPAYFSHIRFGQYYSEIVNEAAEEFDFHPLLLYSVMRQESLFESFVRSSAEARGLMQIVPRTGATIANSNPWVREYSEEDLYRPLVSIKFGAWYLNNNRTLLDGDIYATLAAYNGGPGNAIEWQALGKGDPDLMLESIRFAETRDYIQSIYETYRIYKDIYAAE